MNFEVNGKVNAIKTDISNSEDYEDYEDEDLDFEQPDENEPSPSNNDDKKDLKKKLIKLMILIGGGMLILLLILLILSKMMNKSYSYEKVEEIMKEAAESYFSENSGNLPKEESQTVEIEAATLSASGKMKSLDDYLGEGHGCSGKVQVKKIGENYVYTSYLSCGDKYSTKFLADTIANDENLVGSGYGLYLQNDNYVFKGEEVNNFIQLDAKLWRIMRVNSDKTITLTLAKTEPYTYVYDNRYNESATFEYGINNFQTSRVREQLQKMFNTTDENDKENYLLSEKDKSHLVSYDICIGKMGKNDTIHDNSIECSQTTPGYVGLLTVSDYMNASTDTACNRVSSESCQNYNYLNNSGAYWLATPNNQDTYSVYAVSGGSIRTHIARELYRIRPVITLSSNTVISGGKGTEEEPFIVK